MILFIIISKVSLCAWCKIVDTLAGVWHFGTFQGTALYMPDGILYLTKIVIKQFVVLFVFCMKKKENRNTSEKRNRMQLCITVVVLSGTFPVVFYVLYGLFNLQNCNVNDKS